jgi:hypothetical protein
MTSTAPETASTPSPVVDFTTLVLSLREAALLELGLKGDASVEVDAAALEASRYQIELLAMLEVKTRGNLSEDEARLLGAVVYELRLAFVEASRRTHQPAEPA